MNFIEQLKQIPDHRSSKGKHHPLWLVMCLTLLGVLCGYHGYRPLVDFCQKHWETLQTMLELPTESRIPSYSTFRRVIQGVEIEPLVKLFNEWCKNSPTGDSGQWLAMDGKSIKCTVTNQTVLVFALFLRVNVFSLINFIKFLIFSLVPILTDFLPPYFSVTPLLLASPKMKPPCLRKGIWGDLDSS